MCCHSLITSQNLDFDRNTKFGDTLLSNDMVLGSEKTLLLYLISNLSHLLNPFGHLKKGCGKNMLTCDWLLGRFTWTL